MRKICGLLLLLICLLHSVDSFAQWRYVTRFNDSGEEHWVSENYKIDENGYYIIKRKRVFPKRYKDHYVINHHFVIETYAITPDKKNHKCLYEEWYDNDGNISEKKNGSGYFYSMPSVKATNYDAAYFAMLEIIENGHPSEIISKKVSKVYTINEVDEPPTFPGGGARYRQFLLENLQPLGQEWGAEGISVRVEFTVEADGRLTNFKLLSRASDAIEKALGNEALRVVKMMPKWNPGLLKGQCVPVICTQIIIF